MNFFLIWTRFNNISLSSPSLSWGLRCSEEFSSLDILGEILELVVEIRCFGNFHEYISKYFQKIYLLQVFILI